MRSFLKKLINKGTLFLGNFFGLQRLPTLFNGVWLWIPKSAWIGIRHPTYEPFVAEALRNSIKKGDVVWDIGAHFGLWSLYANRLVGRRGSISAYEPSPAFEVLKTSVKGRSTISSFRMGLGNHDGRASFFDQGEATSGSFVKEVTEINAPYSPNIPIGEATVELRKLDSLVLESKQRPNVIKLDVEGFEIEVLEGASQFLRDGDCTWIIEVHPLQLERSGSSPQAVYDKLSSHGYQIQKLDGGQNQPETILARRIAAKL